MGEGVKRRATITCTCRQCDSSGLEGKKALSHWGFGSRFLMQCAPSIRCRFCDTTAGHGQQFFRSG